MKRALRSVSRSRVQCRLLTLPLVLFEVICVSAILGSAGSLSAEPIFRSVFLSFDVGLHPQSIAIGDLNEDGIPDLVTAFSSVYGSGTTVSVRLGNGGGTFDAAVYYGVGVNPTSVAIADLSGDGNLDLAVANSGVEWKAVEVIACPTEEVVVSFLGEQNWRICSVSTTT